MGLRTLDDGGYHGGMNRDLPSWMLKKGEVYDALNMVFDKPGIARQRGGSTAIFAGAQTAFCNMIGWSYWTDTATNEVLYGYDAKGGGFYSINPTTGATTALNPPGFSSVPTSRPVRHFGSAIFPMSVTRFAVQAHGAVINANFSSLTASNVTANNGTITLAGADVTTNIKVGQFVIALGLANTNGYFGRVTSITNATNFTVWPLPGFTFAYQAVGGLQTIPTWTAGAGTCACSWQNRLLYGNTYDWSLGAGVSNPVYDRRFIYSPLLTETGGGAAFPRRTQTMTGANYMDTFGWPKYNYVEVPGSDPIVALEPVSDNELLVLTSTHPVLVRGNLVTQTSATSQQVTFDISEINEPYGCLSDLSVHRTPRGIVWAGPDGVYVYRGGGSVEELTKNKIRTYWQSLVRGANFAIHGASYVRGVYIISGTSAGSTFALGCDLQDLQWARLSGVGTDNFYSVPRPTDPSQVFAARWWDIAGAAPSMSNGQVVRLESLLDPYVAGSTKTDADGTAVPFSLTTRVLAGDTDTQKLQARMTTRYQAALPAASVTVTAQSHIDAADITAAAVRSLGSLSNTEVRTISAATNATPIVCTTSVVHGLQSGDFVDINGGTGLTHVNGRWRVTVTSTTQFSLDASSGNGVYNASTATVKKVTETDFATNTLDLGQGVSFVIASSGTVNNFELHGVRIAYYEKPSPVLSV